MPKQNVSLTPKRQEVLNTFKGFGQEYPHPPTIGEIAEILGVSRVTAFAHIRRLVKDGYLVETKAKVRKYVLQES